ncbi:hypothetical protein DFH08DRAFT_928947 [Mycena albidolilacea]|uniref:Uncharacterized protein n=1 Tax=Mycena albidolilacea TaxID=1033008 RepID=A0AAD7AWD4_9AGAR|nr:hypothetical protein DFH08DRAFT_928947 [Mycena albidolilacea]
MTFSALPPEICSAICAELKELGGSLTLVCRTSRIVCREVQRILYHSIDLRGRKRRAVKSWAHTVTQHTHLAERVHALVLKLPSIESMEVSDGTKIVAALRKCVNLKELRGIHGWLISDCSFRLEKFDGDFWRAQTQIRVLSLPYCLPSLKNQLPELIALSTMLGTLPPTILPARPLQRVETEFYPDFDPLMQYSQTLTILNLRGLSAHFLFSVPGNLATVGDSNPHYHYHAHTPTPILQEKFRKLQTFVLHARNLVSFVNDGNDYTMTSAPDLKRLGVDMLSACPTLLRAAFGMNIPHHEEISCVLTRPGGGGAIHAEAGTALDLEALDMF